MTSPDVLYRLNLWVYVFIMLNQIVPGFARGYNLKLMKQSIKFTVRVDSNLIKHI